MVAATFDQILVFDANAGRRQLIHETLEELGYRVSQAWDADDARRVLAEDAIDLLIVDVLRIGDTAHTLIDHAASIGIPSVVLSKDRRLRHALTPDAPGFVENPFPLQQLADEVERVLRLGAARSRHSSPGLRPRAECDSG